MNFITRRKSIDTITQQDEHHRLRPTLRWPHLVAMGVGAIVGTGIYTLTGVGAGLAGPGVILSFLLCGVICAAAALCYAEMATMMPAAGSAYTYTYAVLGELLAWIVGWSLLLEYTVGSSAVAVGWSAHVAEFVHLPPQLLQGYLTVDPHTGMRGLVNLPAVLGILIVTALLIVGTKESATVNIVLVAIKLSALVLFVLLAMRNFDVARFHPFLPYGVFAHVGPDNIKRGVFAAAAIIFFAFYGFDAVSTAAEETINPGRDLTIGIVGSMALCTVIYIVVAGAALGAAPASVIAKTAAPLVYVLNSLHNETAGEIVAGAAVVALPSVMLVLLYGQSRIFFVMARDGLIPRALAAVNQKRGTPALMTSITGLIAAAIAGMFDIQHIAELANAGTLAAFAAVSLCVLVMRVREPNRPRIFRVPLAWIVAPFCIVGCVYLFAEGLNDVTHRFFIYANLIGLVLYFLYGVWASRLAQTAGATK